LLNVIKRVMAI